MLSYRVQQSIDITKCRENISNLNLSTSSMTEKERHVLLKRLFRGENFVQICVTRQVNAIRKFVTICQLSEVSGD